MEIGRPLLAIACLGLLSAAAADAVNPPIAKKVTSYQTFPLETLTDDYNWIEEKSNPEVRAYVDAETEYLHSVLDYTSDLQQELFDELYAQEITYASNVPVKIGEHMYYSQYGDEDYQYWYRQAVDDDGNTTGEPELILDENEVARELNATTVFVVGLFSVSPDERYICYTVDIVGDEHYTAYFKDIVDDVMMPDQLHNVYYALVWSQDSRTVFYNSIDSKFLQPWAAYRYKLGTDTEPTLLYQETDLTYTVVVSVTSSSNYIIMNRQGQITNEIRYLPSSDPTGNFTILHEAVEFTQWFMDDLDGFFYIWTDYNDNINYALYVTSAENPGAFETWRVLVPHRTDTQILRVNAYARGSLVLWELRDYLQHIHVLELNTTAATIEDEYYVSLPDGPSRTLYALEEMDTVTDWSTMRPVAYYNTKISFMYSSYIQPPYACTWDMEARTLSETEAEYHLPGFKQNNYKQEIRLYDARDGETVPVFLLYRKDLDLSTPQKVYSTGYGAYGSNHFAYFDPELLPLADRGYICARLHIRGSGIKGMRWYRGGRVLTKKNTFFDYIDTIQGMIDDKMTSPELVAARGRSAGGLLMGSLITMAPELFNVIWAQVPFVDVLNDLFDYEVPWTVWEYPEWGDPNDEEVYWYQKSYDPYRNANATNYPNIIFESGWEDPLVSYAEPTKMTARLRSVNTNPNNTIVLFTTDAGHMGNSGEQYYWDLAMEYAFLISSIQPDENECVTGSHECDTNAICSNTYFAYTCACADGYSGDGYACVADPEAQNDEDDEGDLEDWEIGVAAGGSVAGAILVGAVMFVVIRRRNKPTSTGLSTPSDSPYVRG